MDNQNLSTYSSPDQVRSRWSYTFECAFEYFVALLVSDAYLANLLKYMGISDSMTGVISSLISFAFLFQLFSLVAVKHIVNVKRAAIFFHFASQMFFMSLFLLPFLPMPTEYKTVVVIACILIAYFGNYLVTTVIFKWGMSFVDPRKRASFGATKEMISLISGMVFTLVVGFAVDKFAASGNIEGGFIFLAIGILVSSIFDLICLVIMKNPKEEKREVASEPIMSVVKKLFKNKAFVSLLGAGVLLYAAMYMTSGFLGTYKTLDLGFSVGQAQIINTCGVLARFALSKPLGKFSDKTSYRTGFTLGISILALAYLLNIFTSPSLRWMIYVYVIISSIAQAAIHQNFMNIVFDYVDNQYFVQATSIKAAVSGISGFLATLCGAAILNFVQTNGNAFFGIELRAQQLLSAISFVIMLALIAFVLIVLKKYKKVSE